MSDTQIAAHQLAQAIARFRLAERDANRSLVVAGCTIRNIAARFGFHALLATLPLH